jgi:ketosteroid isomerase-like protein
MSNKSKAEAFVRSLASGQIDDTLVAPSMTCWAGAGEPFGLPRLKAGVAVLKTLFDDSGLTMTIETSIEEGDRVAVLARSHGTLKDGPVYSNDYHYAFRFDDGLIVEMREYMNSAIVNELIRPRLIVAMQADGAKS